MMVRLNAHLKFKRGQPSVCQVFFRHEFTNFFGHRLRRFSQIFFFSQVETTPAIATNEVRHELLCNGGEVIYSEKPVICGEFFY